MCFKIKRACRGLFREFLKRGGKITLKLKKLLSIGLRLTNTDGWYKAHMKAKLEANLFKSLWTCGFDTLRLGLMKSGNWKSNNDYLRDVFVPHGATVRTVKSIIDKELFWSDDSEVIAFYEGATGKLYSGIEYRFSHALAVWLIEYKGAVTVVVQWMNGAYLHWECHGLSQPHHSKGALKNELMEKVLGNTETYLLGYDVAFDTPLPFNHVLDDIVEPWCFIQILNGQSMERFGLHRHKTGTVYLQPENLKGTNKSVRVYDKTLKHGLDFVLTRIEMTMVSKEKPQVSFEYLRALLEIERRTFLGTDSLVVEATLG